MWISKKKLAEIKAEIKAESFDDGKRVGVGEYQQLVINSARAEQKNAELSKECAELKKRVRTQAKADMIFEAIKLIRMGLMDDSPSVQPDLQSQYAAMQAAQTQMQYRGQSGILGGLYGLIR